MRRILGPLGAVAIVAAIVAAAGAAMAQPLTGLCPVRSAINHGNGNVTPWGPGRPDAPMLRVTLAGPNAVCNDGSQAVMYVRPSPLLATDPGSPDANRWIVHFKGGGFCSSYDSCEERWCSTPPGILNRAGLMSSQWAPDRIVGSGILDATAANDFGDWNHVLLFYCSSDLWLGNLGPGLAQPFPAGAVSAPYDISFRGAVIAATALATLSAAGGANPDPGVAPRGVDGGMPSLLDATALVVSGDSAGAVAVRHYADRIADRLDSATGRDVPVLAVVDAASAPQLSNPTIPRPAGTSYTTVVAGLASTLQSFYGVGPAMLDPSCQALASDPNTCYDDRFVLLNHLTTPAFTRTDLYDLVVSEGIVDLITGGGPPLGGQLELGQMTADDLALLASPGAEARDPIAVFGSLCGAHVGILESGKFLNQVAVPGGLTFHDAVSAWAQGCLAGACPAYAEIAANTGPRPNFYDPASPSCP